MERKKQEHHLALQKMIQLNPMNTLQKGYVILQREKKMLRSVEEINLKDEIEIRMIDGRIKAEVKEKRYENKME